MPKSSAPTVALVSLGCPKNLVDAEAILGALDAHGYRIIDDTEQANIIIVNTCAFIEPAVEEAVDALLELSELKARGTLKALIATGCLPQRYGDALADELEEVDAFVGIGDTQGVLDAIASALKGKRQAIIAAPRPLLDYDAPRWRTGAEWLSYIKIADGCDHQCAFCTIPSIRGEYRSGAPDGIASEFARLAEAGVREVCLIAQDTTNYGIDLRRQGGKGTLAGLLRRLGSVDYDGWVRIQYMHPAHITDDLLEVMSSMNAAATPGGIVVPYFDIPLQHVSRDVLRRMGRPGDEGQYLALVRRIRKAIPEAAIRTTFIVGFPGETEEDFAALLEFIEAARLDRVSVFRYWPEDGTRAAALPDHVPIEDADERLDAILVAQEEISLSVNRGFVGQTLRVLVEKELRKGKLWSGRSYRDAPEVDGEVKLEADAGELEPGTFVDVRITGAEVHDLRAKVEPPR